MVMVYAHGGGGGGGGSPLASPWGKKTKEKHGLHEHINYHTVPWYNLYFLTRGDGKFFPPSYSNWFALGRLNIVIIKYFMFG